MSYLYTHLGRPLLFIGLGSLIGCNSKNKLGMRGELTVRKSVIVSDQPQKDDDAYEHINIFNLTIYEVSKLLSKLDQVNFKPAIKKIVTFLM